MKTKHTKGCWVINKDKTGLYIDSESGSICMMNNYQPSNKANAKLIAAAPELLEALNEFFELDNDPHYHGMMPVFLREFRNKAKEAIKKATE